MARRMAMDLSSGSRRNLRLVQVSLRPATLMRWHRPHKQTYGTRAAVVCVLMPRRGTLCCEDLTQRDCRGSRLPPPGSARRGRAIGGRVTAAIASDLASISPLGVGCDVVGCAYVVEWVDVVVVSLCWAVVWCGGCLMWVCDGCVWTCVIGVGWCDVGLCDCGCVVCVGLCECGVVMWVGVCDWRVCECGGVNVDVGVLMGVVMWVCVMWVCWVCDVGCVIAGVCDDGVCDVGVCDVGVLMWGG
ncbi:Protein of unknown function [Gryllus bimaculatus]|nr:Protein of unknown function [Gryllus bimaculatus]